MKKTLLILAVVSGISVPAFSAACVTTPPNNNVIAGATGALNPTGAGDTYSQPCIVGNASFDNFSYDLVQEGFTTPTPTISMVSVSANGNDANITFNPNLSAGGDIEFEFEVTDPNITSAMLGWSGSGTGSVNEVICTAFVGANGVCNSAVNGGTQLAVLNVNSTTTTEVSKSFAPVSSVWIFKDISAGNAPYSTVSQDYINTGATTPEPASMMLLGAGLLGLGLIRRRGLKS